MASSSEYACNNCCSQIVENRFKCLNCHDFDLCEQCSMLEKLEVEGHSNYDHILIKLDISESNNDINQSSQEEIKSWKLEDELLLFDVLKLHYLDLTRIAYDMRTNEKTINAMFEKLFPNQELNDDSIDDDSITLKLRMKYEKSEEIPVIEDISKSIPINTCWDDLRIISESEGLSRKSRARIRDSVNNMNMVLPSYTSTKKHTINAVETLDRSHNISAKLLSSRSSYITQEIQEHMCKQMHHMIIGTTKKITKLRGIANKVIKKGMKPHKMTRVLKELRHYYLPYTAHTSNNDDDHTTTTTTYIAGDTDSSMYIDTDMDYTNSHVDNYTHGNTYSSSSSSSSSSYDCTNRTILSTSTDNTTTISTISQESEQLHTNITEGNTSFPWITIFPLPHSNDIYDISTLTTNAYVSGSHMINTVNGENIQGTNETIKFSQYDPKSVVLNISNVNSNNQDKNPFHDNDNQQTRNESNSMKPAAAAAEDSTTLLVTTSNISLKRRRGRPKIHKVVDSTNPYKHDDTIHVHERNNPPQNESHNNLLSPSMISVKRSRGRPRKQNAKENMDNLVSAAVLSNNISLFSKTASSKDMEINMNSFDNNLILSNDSSSFIKKISTNNNVHNTNLLQIYDDETDISTNTTVDLFFQTFSLLPRHDEEISFSIVDVISSHEQITVPLSHKYNENISSSNHLQLGTDSDTTVIINQYHDIEISIQDQEQDNNTPSYDISTDIITSGEEKNKDVATTIDKSSKKSYNPVLHVSDTQQYNKNVDINACMNKENDTIIETVPSESVAITIAKIEVIDLDSIPLLPLSSSSSSSSLLSSIPVTLAVMKDIEVLTGKKRSRRKDGRRKWNRLNKIITPMTDTLIHKGSSQSIDDITAHNIISNDDIINNFDTNRMSKYTIESITPSSSTMDITTQIFTIDNVICPSITVMEIPVKEVVNIDITNNNTTAINSNTDCHGYDFNHNTVNDSTIRTDLNFFRVFPRIQQYTFNQSFQVQKTHNEINIYHEDHNVTYISDQESIQSLVNIISSDNTIEHGHMSADSTKEDIIGVDLSYGTNGLNHFDEISDMISISNTNVITNIYDSSHSKEYSIEDQGNSNQHDCTSMNLEVQLNGTLSVYQQVNSNDQTHQSTIDTPLDNSVDMYGTTYNDYDLNLDHLSVTYDDYNTIKDIVHNIISTIETTQLQPVSESLPIQQMDTYNHIESLITTPLISSTSTTIEYNLSVDIINLMGMEDCSSLSSVAHRKNEDNRVHDVAGHQEDIIHDDCIVLGQNSLSTNNITTCHAISSVLHESTIGTMLEQSACTIPERFCDVDICDTGKKTSMLSTLDCHEKEMLDTTTVLFSLFPLCQVDTQGYILPKLLTNQTPTKVTVSDLSSIQVDSNQLNTSDTATSSSVITMIDDPLSYPVDDHNMVMDHTLDQDNISSYTDHSETSITSLAYDSYPIADTTRSDDINENTCVSIDSNVTTSDYQEYQYEITSAMIQSDERNDTTVTSVYPTSLQLFYPDDINTTTTYTSFTPDNSYTNTTINEMISDNASILPCTSTSRIVSDREINTRFNSHDCGTMIIYEKPLIMSLLQPIDGHNVTDKYDKLQGEISTTRDTVSPYISDRSIEITTIDKEPISVIKDYALNHNECSNVHVCIQDGNINMREADDIVTSQNEKMPLSIRDKKNSLEIHTEKTETTLPIYIDEEIISSVPLLMNTITSYCNHEEKHISNNFIKDDNNDDHKYELRSSIKTVKSILKKSAPNMMKKEPKLHALDTSVVFTGHRQSSTAKNTLNTNMYDTTNTISHHTYNTQPTGDKKRQQHHHRKVVSFQLDVDHSDNKDSSIWRSQISYDINQRRKKMKLLAATNTTTTITTTSNTTTTAAVKNNRHINSNEKNMCDITNNAEDKNDTRIHTNNSDNTSSRPVRRIIPIRIDSTKTYAKTSPNRNNSDNNPNAKESYHMNKENQSPKKRIYTIQTLNISNSNNNDIITEDNTYMNVDQVQKSKDNDHMTNNDKNDNNVDNEIDDNLFIDRIMNSPPSKNTNKMSTNTTLISSSNKKKSIISSSSLSSLQSISSIKRSHYSTKHDHHSDSDNDDDDNKENSMIEIDDSTYLNSYSPHKRQKAASFSSSSSTTHDIWTIDDIYIPPYTTSCNHNNNTSSSIMQNKVTPERLLPRLNQEIVTEVFIEDSDNMNKSIIVEENNIQVDIKDDSNNNDDDHDTSQYNNDHICTCTYKNSTTHNKCHIQNDYEKEKPKAASHQNNPSNNSHSSDNMCNGDEDEEEDDEEDDMLFSPDYYLRTWNK